MTSPKGFVSWKPNNRNISYKLTKAKNSPMVHIGRSYIELLAEVQDTVEHYRREWPLTQRAWLYRLMGRHGWEKEWERALQRVLDRGRRAGLISWDCMMAGRGLSIEFDFRVDARDMVEVAKTMPYYLNIDLQAGQERRVVLWIETEGYVPRLSGVADEYGADVMCGKGFDTISSKYAMAERIAALGNVTILHIGDLDGSGEVMAEDGLFADLRAFVAALGGDVTLDRIGLLDQHIDDYALPWKPYIDNNSNHVFSGAREAQAEALEVDEAQAIVREAFEKHLDMAMVEARRVELGVVREEAIEILSKV